MHEMCCGQLWVWHMICGQTCDGLYHFAFCLVNFGIPYTQKSTKSTLTVKLSVSSSFTPGGLPQVRSKMQMDEQTQTYLREKKEAEVKTVSFYTRQKMVALSLPVETFEGAWYTKSIVTHWKL